MNYENNQPQGEQKKGSRFGVGILVGVLITLAAAMLVAVLGVFVYMRGAGASQTELSSQEKLNTIQTYLDQYFLGEIDEQAMEDALAEGMLKGTGDKYAAYYSQEEYAEEMNGLSGQYSGIGLSVMMNDNNLPEVIRVFKGSPAEAAGIREKDIIISADGRTDFKDLDELVSLIRGEAGTTVDVVVLRDNEKISMTVERKMLDMETVYSEMLDGSIGYIQLTEFDTVSINQFNTALDELLSQGMTSLIIDLRNNPGGEYQSVVSIADRILPGGPITTIEDKYGNQQTETSDDENQLNIPIVVLINKNSASASELFTAALQDYGAATIVGETSYGKGVVQSIFRLPDGSGIKFTTERYLSPNGRDINGVGVTPDVEVTIPEEAYDDGVVTDEEDLQLQTAIDILKNSEGRTIRK